MSSVLDAVVVGAGPNGLAAAVSLARAGRSVRVLEAAPTPGGGARSAELTLPGFVHDVCSAVHPLAAASPFFRQLPLDAHGLEWVHPDAPLAHPLENGTAAVLERGLEATAQGLGPDADKYVKWMRPMVRAFDDVIAQMADPLRIPRRPLRLARFGLRAMRPARSLAEHAFHGPLARALFAGSAAHSFSALERPFTSAFGILLLASGHAVGWPFPRGGTQKLVDALVSYLRALGGEVVTGQRVHNVDELPRSRAVLLDVTPAQLVKLAGHRLPPSYVEKLRRFRYGPGVFKVDWALSGPIPWRAQACARAGTVHLGGTLEEIAASEAAVSRGEIPEHPYVLVAQHTLFDHSRAPEGQHTGWAYCHVPNGSTEDMTARIEAQMERYAPGFRERILARHTRSPAQYEAYNPNFIGGDISGGAIDGMQLFARPMARLVPYATPDPRLFLCSSSTPPGPGVHGLCGFLAARALLASEVWRKG
ncbi:NAD(P)/FAD-dependent oxidoreductase [Vitiosangium sp. GDMCC 1.1324]|uniref:phytoene desaturase family protein n=1 Tax=Vitiosangium sp. (strain GDMCC 1.1324) TaxID=2138576 RepID=UPI000D346AB9|nr:NAD(P)/FAD-dependent oxidoreductase [Vitiosangium sp. GDMCC 1.1324]PTL79643.1 FAD-dependent oxidoreductase [Vitiosangium sp. GDMCC 1.1324]